MLKEQSILILQNEKLINQLVIGILLIIVALIVLVLFFIKNQARKKRLLSDHEKKLQEIRYDNLKKDLDFKSRELTTTALQIIKKNDFIALLKNQLDTLYKSIGPNNKAEFNKIRKSIDASLETDKNREEFTIIFEQVYQGFYSRIKETCLDISPSELKLAALLKLNFSSKEMSEILGVSSESVRTARSRLR